MVKRSAQGPASRLLRLRRVRQLAGLGKRRGRPAAARKGAAPAVEGGALSETVLRNVALEAVRTGNYWAPPENQQEVLDFIAQENLRLLADEKWLRTSKKIRRENGLSKLYTVAEILCKKHEGDGYNVFVEPDEAIAAKEAEERKARGEGAPPEPEAGRIAELQEQLEELVAAAAGEGDPVGLDEMLELLQGCAEVGEVAAAVYCGTRLEAVLGEGMQRTTLDCVFNALKPLLRPRAAREKPQLAEICGEEGAKFARNPRRGLGLLLGRLAQARKALDVAEGGDAAKRAEGAAEGDKALGSLCDALGPLLAADKEAASFKRRGPLVEVIPRICKAQGLDVSNSLAWHIVHKLEGTGALEVQGRDVKLSPSLAPGGGSLAAFSSSLASLEGLAREWLERRRKRQKAREQGKANKRQRTA